MLKEDISKIVHGIFDKEERIKGSKNLSFYDNWKDEIVEEVVKYIKKQNNPKIEYIVPKKIIADGTKGMKRGVK